MVVCFVVLHVESTMKCPKSNLTSVAEASAFGCSERSIAAGFAQLALSRRPAEPMLLHLIENGQCDSTHHAVPTKVKEPRNPKPCNPQPQTQNPTTLQPYNPINPKP